MANHDILKAHIGRMVKDRRAKTLIRRYLRAGVLLGGVVSVPSKGTPKGGPLSPLVSNIVLDDLDKELERRGRSFCRYADDCNIYVASRRSGERVMGSITRFVEYRLKLKVNRGKSAVARPWQRKFPRLLVQLAFQDAYVHRVAITNARIIDCDDHTVRFKYLDRQRHEWKVDT